MKTPIIAFLAASVSAGIVFTTPLANANALQLAAVTTNQETQQPNKIKPRFKLASSKRKVRPMTISISFQQSYGNGTNISEADARARLYEMAAKECEIISQHFEGQCQLTRFNIRSNRSTFQILNAQVNYSVFRD